MDTLDEQTAKQAEEEIEDKETEVETTETKVEDEESAKPEADGETPEQTENKGKTEETEVDDEGELVIEIEGESPTPEKEEENKEAPEWVKRTRKENRELNRKLKQREKELEELQAKLNPKPEIPPEPTLWDDDVDGDEKKLIAKVRARDKLIAERDAEKKAEQEQLEKENARVKERLDSYKTRKEEISKRIPDYEMHVAEAEDTFSPVQRDAIAYYFKEDAAKLMYAIGKNPPHLEKLSSISDPVEMLLAVKDLQPSLKVSSRKPSTKPETTISGQTKVKTGNDVAERVLEKCMKKGDLTEYRALMRDQEAKKRRS